MTREQVDRGMKKVVRLENVTEEIVRCDRCGREVSDDLAYDDDDLWAQTIEVQLNSELCVRGGAFRRDYCKPCGEGIWQTLCGLINADPDDDSRSDYNND